MSHWKSFGLAICVLAASSAAGVARADTFFLNYVAPGVQYGRAGGVGNYIVALSRNPVAPGNVSESRVKPRASGAARFIMGSTPNHREQFGHRKPLFN
jgi:hypothetical protein